MASCDRMSQPTLEEKTNKQGPLVAEARSERHRPLQARPCCCLPHSREAHRSICVDTSLNPLKLPLIHFPTSRGVAEDGAAVCHESVQPFLFEANVYFLRDRALTRICPPLLPRLKGCAQGNCEDTNPNDSKGYLFSYIYLFQRKTDRDLPPTPALPKLPHTQSWAYAEGKNYTWVSHTKGRIPST